MGAGNRRAESLVVRSLTEDDITIQAAGSKP